MKLRITGNSREPFTLRPDGEQPASPAEGTGEESLPGGWRRLVTGRRDARLFQVSQGGSAGVHWVVAVMLNRRLVHRRFASELHARSWISLACGPREETAESPAAQPEEFSGAGRRR